MIAMIEVGQRKAGITPAVIARMFVVALLLVACTSSSGGSTGGAANNVRCTSNSVTGCSCARQDSAVADPESATLCNTPPAGTTWECCYDVESATGYTTSCMCGAWSCTVHASGCSCSFFEEAPSSGSSATSCTGGVCVKRSDSCQCAKDPNVVLGGDETVPSCVKPSRSRCDERGMKSASSCAGLNWKPPAAPSTGPCIKNGNACGPSKQANGRCCSGYCGEIGTCE